MQGTTADGTLSRSDVGTFRLKAGSSADHPTTLAGLRKPSERP